MSNEEFKRRDIEKNSRNDFDNENESFELESSTSHEYYTALEASTSESENGDLFKATPSKYQFSTETISSVLDEQNEEKKTRFKSQTSLYDIQSSKKSSSREIPSNVALSKDASLQKQSSPVKFKLDENESPLRAAVVSPPRSFYKKPEDVKPLTETVPDKEQVKSKESQKSLKSIKASSVFFTNLRIGEAFVYMVIPPDGGYGWFLIFISFLTQLIVDGAILSIGITLPYISDDLEVSRTKVIFVSAVQIAFYYLSGPVTSAFINKFGFRKVAMIGAAGGSMSILVSSFSPNLAMLIIFYSIMGGTLLSMTWVSSQLILGYYFEKYRPIANGLSCSGSGVGLFMYTQLHSSFIPMLGWRNNTRILAGFLMMAVFLSIAFKDVAPSKIGIMREKRDSDISDTSSEELEMSSFEYTDPPRVRFDDRVSDIIHIESLPRTETKTFKSQEPNCMKKLCMKCTCRERRKAKFREDEYEEEDGVKRYVIKKDIIDKQDLYYTGPAEYSQDKSAKREIISGRDVDLIEDEKTVEAINYNFSIHGIRRSSDDIKPTADERCCGCIKLSRYFPRKIKKAFLVLFNFELFRLLEFQVLFFSAFVYAFGFNIPFLFTKERADLPPNQKSLITAIIGGSNFFSRILSGFIAFTFRQYVPYICGSAITLGGLLVFLSALFGSDIFWFQILYASIFGMAPGFFSTLRAIIYVKYLGLQNLTNAFGLIAMGMGAGLFLGTVLSGFINDITGTYWISFLISGICLMTSGLLKLLLPIILQRKQEK